MDNLVSVVLPVYNGARFLKESIDSVISQTYTNWELLILDDCSTDETPLIAKNYAQNDSRIKYFKNETNLKLPGNLNKGFSLANGQYLTWTSDDNIFLPNALERMLSALNDTGKSFVFASYKTIDENGKETDYWIADNNYKEIIVGSNCVGACFMYTREVYESVGEYDVNLFLVEDFDYWQRILMRYDAVTIPEILYKYRQHDGNLTNTMKRERFYKAYEDMLLKNINGYGKLTLIQKYHFYSALNKCRVSTSLENPYSSKFKIYSYYYNIAREFPSKIKRLIKRIQGKI